MNEPRDPLLLDHEADGIRELDNKLPRWWLLLFYGTIAFSVVYLPYYHVIHSDKTSANEYKLEAEAGAKIKEAALSKFEAAMPTSQPATDQVILATGKDIFGRMCAPCHRPDAGGLVGPNLTDDYWIHGSNFVDNLRTIWNGVPDKGMVTWKGTLKPSEIHAAASYIYTLRGTKPPNPKPPENLAPAQPAVNVYE